MPKRWCVYLITNQVNCKVYVGKTGEAERRWIEHQRCVTRNRGGCPLLRKAMRKHGVTAFTFAVLSEHPDEAAALHEEERQIATRCATDPALGYNLSSGGQSGVLAPGAREQIARTRKGHAVSAETVARCRATKLGYELTAAHVVAIRTRYASRQATGKALAAEYGLSRAMISKIVRGHTFANVGGPIVTERFGNCPPWTPEHRAKMEAGRARTAHSPEADEKRRQKMKGRTMSAAFKEKIRHSWIERRARSNAGG